MDVRDKIYIGGEWVPSSGKGTIEVINAATEEVIGSVPEGSPEDVDRAVAAARAAFDEWSQTNPDERAGFLEKLQQALTSRMNDVADIVAKELGMPLPMAQMIQAGMPIQIVGTYAQLARDFAWEEQIGNSLVVREPIGVVGCITPWNFPLHQITNKVAPAIAAGCCVVVKPSEVTPLTAYLLAEIIHELGLPAGVFNMVMGTGPIVGEAIAKHPGIDMVSFTGSTRAGKRVAALAADTVKRVALELGGKSANVILDDADFDAAVRGGVNACYLNSGQTCSAHTRMLVPKDRLADAERIARETAETFTIGDPFGGEAKLGPLVSKAQYDRVRQYIQKGIDEGATLVTGGADKPENLPKGYFVKPTVFSNVRNDMTIAQEEIFGPVLSIIPYDDEEDAIRIANDSPYGLGGGVWSGDVERAKRVARRIRTGQIDINGASFNFLAPFGGYKQSGNGREIGRYGLEEYLEVKSMQL